MWGGGFRYLILGLLFGVAAAAVYVLHDSTETKIRNIRRVRGEVPGANFRNAEVASLQSQQGPSGGRSYTVRYRFPGDESGAEYEASLPRVPWSRLKKSAPLRVATLPNDPRRYLPQEEWASDESLEFQRAVRTLERVGIGLCALLGVFCAVRAFFMKPTPGR